MSLPTELPIDNEVQTVEPQELTRNAIRREGVLWGRFGLRAGWGMAAYIAVWLIATGIASIFALGATHQMSAVMDARTQAQAHPGTPHPPVHILFTALFVVVNDGIPLVAMLAASWLFSRGERRPFSAYGVGSPRWTDVFPGAFFGLLLLSALIGLLHAMHLLVFDGLALSAGSAVLFGAKWLVAFLLVGSAEEYLFRGYLQYTLTRGMWGLAERMSPRNAHALAFWMAATLLSLLFALMHGGNSGETHFGLLIVFFAGMTFAYALWRTGSLWWAIGFHTTWDWAQSFLYGVPDSGNISVGRLFITHPNGKPLLSGAPDGPEGSVFVTVALALAIVAARFMPKGTQPALEQQSSVDETREFTGVIS